MDILKAAACLIAGFLCGALLMRFNYIGLVRDMRRKIARKDRKIRRMGGEKA